MNFFIFERKFENTPTISPISPMNESDTLRCWMKKTMPTTPNPVSATRDAPSPPNDQPAATRAAEPEPDCDDAKLCAGSFFLCAFAEGVACFPFGVFSWTVDGDDFDEQCDTAAFRVLGIPACLCFQPANFVCFHCTCGHFCSGNDEHFKGEMSAVQTGIRYLLSPLLCSLPDQDTEMKTECVPLLYSSQAF